MTNSKKKSIDIKEMHPFLKFVLALIMVIAPMFYSAFEIVKKYMIDYMTIEFGKELNDGKCLVDGQTIDCKDVIKVTAYAKASIPAVYGLICLYYLVKC